jgi:hypothetical protein
MFQKFQQKGLIHPVSLAVAVINAVLSRIVLVLKKRPPEKGEKRWEVIANHRFSFAGFSAVSRKCSLLLHQFPLLRSTETARPAYQKPKFFRKSSS